MVIKLCMQLVLWIMGLIFQGLSLLPLPDNIYDIMDTIWEYIAEGASVVAAYTHYQYLLLLLSFVISFSLLLNGYRFVMWVLRKIPFWGID